MIDITLYTINNLGKVVNTTAKEVKDKVKAFMSETHWSYADMAEKADLPVARIKTCLRGDKNLVYQWELDRMHKSGVIGEDLYTTLCEYRKWLLYLKRARKFHSTNAVTYLQFWLDIPIPALAEAANMSPKKLYNLRKLDSIENVLAGTLHDIARGLDVSVEDIIDVQRQLSDQRNKVLAQEDAELEAMGVNEPEEAPEEAPEAPPKPPAKSAAKPAATNGKKAGVKKRK